MTDTEWISETASSYGKGGDPSIHAMMKVAINYERERMTSLLIKYIKHVIDREGISFLEDWQEPQSQKIMTSDNWQELHQIYLGISHEP